MKVYFRIISVFIITIFVVGLLTLNVKAEGNENMSDISESDPSNESDDELASDDSDTTWQNDYDYMLDEENSIISLLQYKVGMPGGDIIIPAKAIIDGVSYTTNFGTHFYYFPSSRGYSSSYFFPEDNLTSFAVENGAVMINGAFLFAGQTHLVSVDLSNADTSAVTTMKGMFYFCTDLTDINLSGLDTSNLREISGMYGEGIFENCYSLEKLDISDLNISNVKNLESMFEDCTSLECLDLTSLNTSSATRMTNMFMGCTKLQSIDLSAFDTTNVFDMSNMFSDCSSVTKLDLSNFDTSSVGDMRDMFSGCDSLVSLDISGFDLSGIKYAVFSLSDCVKLEKILTPQILNQDYSVDLPSEMYAQLSDGNLSSEKYTDLMKAPTSAVLVVENRKIDFDDYDGVAPEGCFLLYRMYNPNSGEHFWTGSKDEGRNLVDEGWTFEGPGWIAPLDGIPVYRFYSEKYGDHHYTMDQDEIDILNESDEWTNEGVCWNSSSESDGKPLYRLYNPFAYDNKEAGAHHYTMSSTERDNLVPEGWIDEGIGWYAA